MGVVKAGTGHLRENAIEMVFLAIFSRIKACIRGKKARKDDFDVFQTLKMRSRGPNGGIGVSARRPKNEFCHNFFS